jgi:hypothetical protein
MMYKHYVQTKDAKGFVEVACSGEDCVFCKFVEDDPAYIKPIVVPKPKRMLRPKEVSNEK